MAELVNRFWNDTFTQVILLLVILDLLLGVIASIKDGNFTFSYIGDFMRNDILYKVVPFFIVYGGYVYASSANILNIPGLDLSTLKDGAAAFVIAHMVASILNSLKGLGFLPAAVGNLFAADDPNAKPVPTTVQPS